jgi:hypothetical protein
MLYLLFQGVMYRENLYGSFAHFSTGWTTPSALADTWPNQFLWNTADFTEHMSFNRVIDRKNEASKA